MTPLVVLVVDDNEIVLSLLGRILDRAGMAVLRAASAADARRLWRDSPFPIDMLITDVEMPGQSGFTLADALLAERPRLPILFMSATVPEARHLGGRPFLEKPFTEASLLAEIFELASPVIPRVAYAAG
jgi:CheY-like chemotaxis protein